MADKKDIKNGILENSINSINEYNDVVFYNKILENTNKSST